MLLRPFLAPAECLNGRESVRSKPLSRSSTECQLTVALCSSARTRRPATYPTSARVRELTTLTLVTDAASAGASPSARGLLACDQIPSAGSMAHCLSG